MKPRIIDVAAAAGVSPATVSNVINRKKRVSEDVAKNVMAIALSMGYITDASSNEIVLTRRDSIRLVIFKKHGLIIMNTPFFSELIEGIEQTFRERGYNLMITTVSTTEADWMNHVREITEDANTPFILIGTELLDEDVALFSHAKVPMLVLDRNCADQRLYSVTLDNFGAGFTAGDILMSHGHRHIGFIGSSLTFQNCTYRRYGLECALRECHIELAAEDNISVEPTMEGAYRDMLAHLKARERPLPTAFFAMNDIIAIGASRALKECGYSLPRDVSMVGMDDIPAASIVSPPLTTISVIKADYGRAAAIHLMYALRKNADGLIRPTNVVAQILPVERKSVAEILPCPPSV